MKRNYHVVELDSKGADKTIEMFCKTNGRLLLPLVDLITDARLAGSTPQIALDKEQATAVYGTTGSQPAPRLGCLPT
jgi:hypothetical protein